MRAAVMRTIVAFGAPGVADCVYHAAATAGALRAAGLPAKFTAGAAWWSVGSGPGDIVQHGYDSRGRLIIGQNTVIPASDGTGNITVWPAHAWATYTVAGVPIIVDMTTYQIPEKARLIAESDGMPLDVTFDFGAYQWCRYPRAMCYLDSLSGDWCLTEIPGFVPAMLPGPIKEQMMRVAAIAYHNPAVELDVFDVATGKSAAEALTGVWSDFSILH